MMYKIWATIVKDFRVLGRDKVGLTLMFAMPILLVVVITSIQNNTFQMVNDNKMLLLVCNKDGGESSLLYEKAVDKVGMFKMVSLPPKTTDAELKEAMSNQDILVALVIPDGFSKKIESKASVITDKVLIDTSANVKHALTAYSDTLNPIKLYYNPVLEESFRHSIQGALKSTLQIVEGKKIVQTIYAAIYSKAVPAEIEQSLASQSLAISEEPVSKDGSKKVPNATQHNVPAWTVFAMFFIVISLGGGVVKEKQSGSFLRLKTLPTSYNVAMVSKQAVFLTVTMLQVVAIFSLGMWLFPFIGLPKLSLPSDLFGLLLVSLISGWCAVSYAICVGVVAQTQEQANGFGAVSIIILAAIGGIMVPSFAMPASFEILLKMSPLHWCLDSYYGLFLERGRFVDVLASVVPLLGFIVVFQLVTLYSLKRQNLI
jgi:ABC-2 type transport system permease protein